MTGSTRERNFCKRCEWEFKGAASGRKPFAVPGAEPHYAPDLPFRSEHITLDVAVDPKAKTLKGSVTHRVRVISPGQKRIKLDQIGLKIHETLLSGKPTKHSIDGHTLWIELSTEAPVGESIEFTVNYSLTNSRRGLYFTGPDKDYPNKPYQVWSQGQDEDSRYWFPTFDYPNQKATSEIIATVPKGFTAVSNGALLSKKDEGTSTRFHYRLGTPHVTYLISLAVAEFAAWEDKGPNGLPIQYFVAPGREEDGKRAFSNTPKMIEVFEKKTGVKYPYEKYSQIAVQDFIFGGMENTSATTQTDLTLHDARAHIDFSSDPLVSHELAHQWFGDLLTCRDWSHGWLNEGFATFMERVWIENYTGEGGGVEEAKYYAFQDWKEYLEDDQSHYRRPIVCNTYIEPIDLFDTHLYQKGGLVLNLIRQILGEDLFWKSINLYVTRHRGQNVETLDLIRAIEDATGKNLRRVFDQWIFSAGYPEFELTYSWHDDTKMAEFVIEQKQICGQASVTVDGALTPLFQLPAVLEMTLEGGKKITQKIEICSAKERLFLSMPSKPLMARFDALNSIPKTTKFPRPKEMLLYQLANDPDCMARIEAIQELTKIADPEIIEVIGKAIVEDKFWGVQVEAAKALSDIRSEKAKELLIRGLKTKSPKGRKAVVAALGSYKDADVGTALKPLAEKDESYYVEGEATAAFGTAKGRSVHPLTNSEIDEVEKFLILQTAKNSYRDLIRGGAYRGIVELPGIGRGERPKALDALMAASRKGSPLDARTQSIVALGRIAKTASGSERAKIISHLNVLADEDHFRIRMALLSSLAQAEAPEASAILYKIYSNDLDGRVKRTALSVLGELRTSGTLPESVGTLRQSLEKLEEEHRKLKGMVEELKSAQKQG